MSEAPGQQVDQQIQKIESGEDLQYYQDIVDSLKDAGEDVLSKETLAPLLKAIDEAEFNNSLKKKLFDQIRDAIKSIEEPVRSALNELANEYESDNVEIAEDADMTQIGKAIENDKLRDMFLNLIEGSHLGVESLSEKMVVWEEGDAIIKSMLPKEGDEEQVDSLEGKHIHEEDFVVFAHDDGESVNVSEIQEKIQENLYKNIEKIYGQATATAFEKSRTKILAYSDNLEALKEGGIPEGVVFDRIDVQRHIMGLTTKITDENRGEVIASLQKISGQEFDQNDAIEDIITQTNSIDAKEALGLFESRDLAGKQFADSLIQMENNEGSSFMSEFITDIMEKGGPLATLLTLILGPDFAEAFAEGNVEKRKALINLVSYSKDSDSPLYLEDFKDVDAEKLDSFFKKMDSWNVAYDKKDFWKQFLTGEKAGESIKKVRASALEQDETFFKFEENNDFEDNNEGFLKKLNEIPKNPEQKKEEPKAKADELQTENGEAVASGTPDQSVKVVPQKADEEKE